MFDLLEWTMCSEESKMSDSRITVNPNRMGGVACIRGLLLFAAQALQERELPLACHR